MASLIAMEAGLADDIQDLRHVSGVESDLDRIGDIGARDIGLGRALIGIVDAETCGIVGQLQFEGEVTLTRNQRDGAQRFRQVSVAKSAILSLCPGTTRM